MSKSRLEAFSDGVIAILITIMVLELKVPQGTEVAALAPLVPVFLSYVLSFVFVGIYWNNHHHMLHAVQRVTGGGLWANLHLLFWLSLIPFVTGWMSENHFEALPVAVYGAVLFMSASVDQPMRSRGGRCFASAAYGADGFGITNGSPGCGMATQSSIAAASRTLFVWTKFCARPYPISSIIGPNETRPRDGLRPTPPQKLAGMRIDPAMSDPCAIGTMPAITADIPPPVEPPAE